MRLACNSDYMCHWHSLQRSRLWIVHHPSQVSLFFRVFILRNPSEVDYFDNSPASNHLLSSSFPFSPSHSLLLQQVWFNSFFSPQQKSLSNVSAVHGNVNTRDEMQFDLNAARSNRARRVFQLNNVLTGGEYGLTQSV